MIFSPLGTTVFTYDQIQVDGHPIERIGDKFKTKSFKLVGVHLDDKLSWINQATHIRNKLASANYTLARVRKLVPQRAKLVIYNSLFRCHMENSLLVWGDCNGASH